MDTRNKIHLLDRNLPEASPAAQHLTDEQFTDLLLGTIPPAVTAHLEACPPCAQEAQRVSGAIGSFSQQSRLWAEQRAVAQRTAALRAAVRSNAPAHQPLLMWLSRPAAWSVAAAALILAVVAGIGTAHRSSPAVALQQPVQQQTQPQVAAVQPAPAELAAQVSPANIKAGLKSDNDLLSAIDGELSADAAPPAGMYGLKVATRDAHAKSLKRISN